MEICAITIGLRWIRRYSSVQSQEGRTDGRDVQFFCETDMVSAQAGTGSLWGEMISAEELQTEEEPIID